jgi:putative transposase
MFGDEAGFGRISEPANCWAPPKERPSVPNQRIRQYKTVYGAISPVDGESLYVVLDKSNTENMNIFLQKLSARFTDDLILLCLDRASWHKSKDLKIPSNIRFTFIPPRTPEMNPIELMWREIRKRGFKNIAFPSLDAVIDKFWEVVSTITNCIVISISFWDWINDIISK